MSINREIVTTIRSLVRLLVIMIHYFIGIEIQQRRAVGLRNRRTDHSMPKVWLWIASKIPEDADLTLVLLYIDILAVAIEITLTSFI